MKPALLLIDLQNDYLASPNLQPPAVELIRKAAALLAECRRSKIPVIHVWTTVRRDDDRRLPHWRAENRWQCELGTSGHATPDVLQPLPGELVIHKSGFNAFADASLEEALKRLTCDAVILTGLHLHTCVRIAAMESLERGYQVRIAEDAVGSNDPIHAAATRRWLEERCVEFGEKLAVNHISPEVALAHAGWKRWRNTGTASRLDILGRAADALELAAPALAHQMAVEIGKPIAHGLEEVRRGAANIRDVIRRARDFEFEKREGDGSVRYQPLGVIALISPWNNPVAIPVGKIAPALAYGNTVVWKPSPPATQVSQAILKLLREAGVPDDAVRLVPGDRRTAQALASSEHIAAVTLTGSIAAGYAMQEICARRMIPLQAELNGNNAAIVWDDADLQHAAKQIAWGAFGFAGQRCTANRRVIVSHAVFSALLEELISAGENLVWGDPLDPATDIGPVVSASKRDETAAIVACALQDNRIHGVHLLYAARAQESWVSGGAYAQPAILCCDCPDHPVVQ
ncbi:MAG TPA: aldehyde dehydrogenase family protein, partial [Bryobacteraceae bacterium]|nr:aldehyde dehydrogenase family protein [Bryobacteraceae bacterium]